MMQALVSAWKYSQIPSPDSRLASSFLLDRPVIDMTGLSGVFDVDLAWAEELAAEVPGTLRLPSVFTAVKEQLGLRLEGRKALIDFLVIDHVESTPYEN